MNRTTRSSSRRANLRVLWLLSAGALIAGCGGGDGSDADALAEDAPAPAAGGPAPAPASGPAPAPAPGPAPAPAPAPIPAPAPAAPIAQTEAGIPEGLPSSRTIGAAGGTLASSDGRLTISVPAGALASDTTFGIQPITATAPGALGPAYRLTPEGVTFAQALTLTFAYSAGEAGATTAASLRVARREASGRWSVASATPDAAQRQVSVATTRFSDWSFVPGLQIAPASAVVAVNQQQFLRVLDCAAGPDPADPNAPAVLRECRVAAGTDAPSAWSVNSVANGNAAVGTINFLAGLLEFANYKAPAAVPAQNPVAVGARVDAAAGRITLVSNIKVVDEVTAYEGTVFGKIVIRVNGEEQYVETSANLRFAYNAALSGAGTRWYDGSGTAFVRGRPFGCGEGSGSAPVQGASLQLHTEGPLAGTYSLGGGANATATLTCGNPPRELTGPFLVGGFSAFGSDICPALQIGSNPGRLAGTWFCNVAEGTTGRSNWTLRAVE